MKEQEEELVSPIHHQKTAKTANKVINHKLVKENMTLEETAAGRELNEIKELVKKHEEELVLIKSEIRLARSEFAMATTGVNDRLAKLMTVLDELKRDTRLTTGYASLTNTMYGTILMDNSTSTAFKK